MEIPAAMLQKKISHITKNRPLNTYWLNVPLCSSTETAGFAPAATGAVGAEGILTVYPGGGLRRKEPTIMVSTIKIPPSQAKTGTRFPLGNASFLNAARSRGAKNLLISRAPRPKPMTTMPVIKPFLSGNHLAAVATGVTYPRPRPQPPMTPYPIYNSGNELILSARAPIRYPRPKRNPPAMANFFGPYFGRLIPPHAAESPRQQMARLNAQAAWEFVHP